VVKRKKKQFANLITGQHMHIDPNIKTINILEENKKKKK